MYCKTVKQQHKEERFHLPTSLPTFQAAPVIQELIGWHHISDYSPIIVCSLVWQWAFGSADAMVAVTKSFACILSVLPVNFTKLSSFILFFRDPQGSSSAPQYTERLISPAQALIYSKWIQKESETDSQHGYITTDKPQPAAGVILLPEEQTTAIQGKVAHHLEKTVTQNPIFLPLDRKQQLVVTCLWREIRWRICSKMVLSDPTSDQCGDLSQATVSCFLPSPSKFPGQSDCCGCANSSGAAAWPAGERNYSHYL